MNKQTECCTPEGQIKRYVDCIGCDKKSSQRVTTGKEFYESADKVITISKQIALVLCLTLCGCGEYQTQEQGNRIQFKDYNCDNHALLSIVAVDSIEFLVNHRTGHMVRITKGGEQ